MEKVLTSGCSCIYVEVRVTSMCVVTRFISGQIHGQRAQHVFNQNTNLTKNC